MASKNEYPSTVQYDELDAMRKRIEAEQNVISPEAVGTPQIDPSAGPKKGRFDHIFGTSPETQQAYDARNTAFQEMLNARKQTVQQQRTDDVNMARYNALGNLLTTLGTAAGWRAAGSTGGYTPYDNRQYIAAFNRAVKAADDVRNIGNAESEYKYKLADEDYKRRLAIDDENRRNQFAMDKLAEQYQQKADLAQQKFENDMKKEQAKAALRMELAQFNAAHKITGRSSGGSRFSVDEREKLKLLDGYLKYAQDQTDRGNTPKEYTEWLGAMGYTTQDGTAAQATTPKPAGGNGSNSTRTQTQTRTYGPPPPPDNLGLS